VGGGAGGGGTSGGGRGGPTVEVTVESAVALTPNVLARLLGDSAALCACAVSCAAAEAAEPVLMVVTDAATACTRTVVAPRALELTPRSAATAVASTVGAARVPLDDALKPRSTVNDAPICSARRVSPAKAVWRRDDSSGTTVQPMAAVSCAHMLFSSASAICEVVTPGGSGADTDEV